MRQPSPQRPKQQQQQQQQHVQQQNNHNVSKHKHKNRRKSLEGMRVAASHSKNTGNHSSKVLEKHQRNHQTVPRNAGNLDVRRVSQNSQAKFGTTSSLPSSHRSSQHQNNPVDQTRAQDNLSNNNEMSENFSEQDSYSSDDGDERSWCFRAGLTPFVEAHNLPLTIPAFVVSSLIITFYALLASGRFVESYSGEVWDDEFWQGRNNDTMCEAPRWDQFVRQPASTLSSSAYIIAGCFCITMMVLDLNSKIEIIPYQREKLETGSVDPTYFRSPVLMIRQPFWSFAFGISLYFLGCATFLTHASRTELAARISTFSWWFLNTNFVAYSWARFVLDGFSGVHSKGCCGCACSIECGSCALNTMGAIVSTGFIFLKLSVDAALYSFLEFSNRTELYPIIFLSLLALFLLPILLHYLNRRHDIDSMWPILTLALFIGGVAYILLWYDGTEFICDPQSFWQLHAAWQVASALCAVFIYIFFRSDMYKEEDDEDDHVDDDDDQVEVRDEQNHPRTFINERNSRDQRSQSLNQTRQQQQQQSGIGNAHLLPGSTSIPRPISSPASNRPTSGFSDIQAHNRERTTSSTGLYHSPEQAAALRVLHSRGRSISSSRQGPGPRPRGRSVERERELSGVMIDPFRSDHLRSSPYRDSADFDIESTVSTQSRQSLGNYSSAINPERLSIPSRRSASRNNARTTQGRTSATGGRTSELSDNAVRGEFPETISAIQLAAPGQDQRNMSISERLESLRQQRNEVSARLQTLEGSQQEAVTRIEMWTCSHCGYEDNEMAQSTCVSCGHPKPARLRPLSVGPGQGQRRSTRNSDVSSAISSGSRRIATLQSNRTSQS